jgi:anti-sigma factor RsiW
VTGFLDGALTNADRLEIESHITVCAACRVQLEEERAVAAALRIHPPPSLPHGLAARVRRRSRRPVTLRRRVWVPSLAAMLLLVLVGRNSSQFVAWQVALDHAHCFGKRQVPAEVLTDDPMRLTAWFDAQGTELPHLPASAGGLDMVGGRYCRLLDRTAVHVYYGGGDEQLSLFVIPGSVRVYGDDEFASGLYTVEMLRVAGANVALVSTDRPSIGAFRRSLKRTIATARAVMP